MKKWFLTILLLLSLVHCKSDPLWLNIYQVTLLQGNLQVTIGLKAQFYLHSSLTKSCSFFLKTEEIASYSNCLSVVMPEGGYHVEQWKGVDQK